MNTAIKQYFLDDYNLNYTQITYSCILSEYGLRHLNTAWEEKNIVHGMIGLLELIPLIGLVFSLFERFVAFCFPPMDPFSIPPSHVRYTVLENGSQRNCVGSIEIDKAKNVCCSLNQKNTNGIYFTYSLLNNSVSGGTCSAMSFDFANRYLEMRKTLSPKEIFDRIGSDYKESTQEFRTIQAAFNTIGKVPGIEPKDFHRAKIDAMLRFYDRKIVAESAPLDIQKGGAIAKMRKILRELKEGVFIFRTILPAENQKGEILGHTTVLVREKDRDYFYEPCTGIHELEKGSESTTLCHALARFNHSWMVHFTKAYQIA